MSKIDRNIQLTPFQVFTLIFISGFSAVDIMLERTLKIARGDTWITCIVAAFLAFFSVFIITSLAKRFPNDTIFTFSKKIFGQFLGTIINLIYIIYSIMFTVFILKVLMSIIYNLTFRKTPLIIMIILFLSTSVYISTKNAVVISRVTEILFIPLVFVLASIPLFHFEINFDYVLPIGSTGIENILKAIIPYLNAFLGLYIIMLFIPYIKNKKASMKSALLGICFVTLFHSFDSIVINGFFGPDRASMFFWTGLKYVSTISTPVFERVDLIIVMIISAVSLININFGFYFAKIGFVETLGLKGDKKNYLIIAIVFIISVYMTQSLKNYNDLLVFNEILVFFSIGANFILPLILFIFSLLLKRKEIV